MELALTLTTLTLAERHEELVHAEDVDRVYAERPPLRDCYDKRCMLELGDLVKANRLLSVRITRSGRLPEAESQDIR